MEVIRNPKSLKPLMLAWTSASFSGRQPCFGINILLDGSNSIPFCLDFPIIIDFNSEKHCGASVSGWLYELYYTFWTSKINTRHIKAHHIWTWVKIPLITWPSQLPELGDLSDVLGLLYLVSEHNQYAVVLEMASCFLSVKCCNPGKRLRQMRRRVSTFSSALGI